MIYLFKVLLLPPYDRFFGISFNLKEYLFIYNSILKFEAASVLKIPRYSFKRYVLTQKNSEKYLGLRIMILRQYILICLLNSLCSK